MRHVTLLLLCTSACVTGTYGSRAADVTRASNCINAMQIDSTRASTAFDAIMRLRPEFIRRRTYSMSTPGGATPIVYMDGLRIGDVSWLRNVNAATVARIEYASASDAAMRTGQPVPGGALFITSRRP